VERWIQFVEFLALRLGQDLGRDVRPAWPRKSTQKDLVDDALLELVKNGRMKASLKVPDAVGELQVEANLRRKTVTTRVELEAPKTEQRPSTKIAWLTRQLRDADESLTIDVFFVKTREPSSELLKEARETPKALLSPTDKKRDPRGFRISMTRKLGQKRGDDKGSFVGDTKRQALDFYRGVVQDLQEWQAPAPKLPREEEGAQDDSAESDD